MDINHLLHPGMILLTYLVVSTQPASQIWRKKQNRASEGGENSSQKTDFPTGRPSKLEGGGLDVFVAGVFWISKPPGTWDLMSLRVVWKHQT